jgi:outer membrane protein assembly factor BamB
MLMRCWKTRKAPTQKDSKTKELTFKQYDSNAKEILKTVRKASAYVELVISQHTQNKEGQSLSVFPINKVGFVDYRSEKKKKFGYVIDFYPSEKDGEKWTVSSDEQSNLHEFPGYIYGDENIIISSIISKTSLMSESTERRLLAVNAKTGEKMYKKAITDPNYETLILNGLESDSEGNVYLFGN